MIAAVTELGVLCRRQYYLGQHRLALGGGFPKSKPAKHKRKRGLPGKGEERPPRPTATV